MATRYTLAWFQNEIEPQLSGFSLSYSSFEKGDFGNLERVEFESGGLMGTFDFWSYGWLDLHVIDPLIGEEQLNVFNEPEKSQAVATFLAFL
ncbi:hypothetical protein [Hymenobacter arizonensis]|uniref:Uncharacterized protein n=1 Tax=Hymenobacter arizonensis TaxID=1227077 RepID=A0A1I5WV45_HYMAR|nr:hypothetical protein [Hymenobacter arizonensis]SFQ23376.1 hypothetical protein SAMN04515668_1497 [Hymenobacter arizonensis]